MIKITETEDNWLEMFSKKKTVKYHCVISAVTALNSDYIG